MLNSLALMSSNLDRKYLTLDAIYWLAAILRRCHKLETDCKIMKKLIMLFELTLFVISCQINQAKVKTTIEKREMKITSLSFSVVDSLYKYSNADSVLLVDDSLHATLFIGKVNDRNFAVWVIPDSILVFFQHRSNSQWAATDTLKYKLDFSFAECIDLNGDNIKDVRVSCLSGSAGNTENRVFLFDNNTKSFYHNKYYDLPNVEYDAKNKFIKSWWFAGVVHCQEKWKYKITGDSLTFDLGVSYCPDEKTQGETGTIEFYKKVGDKEVITNKLTGISDTIWNIFEQSLWNTSDE